MSSKPPGAKGSLFLRAICPLFAEQYNTKQNHKPFFFFPETNGSVWGSWDKRKIGATMMWLDLGSCEDLENTVGPGLLVVYLSAGKIHRACQDSREIFQQQGLKAVPQTECVWHGRFFLSETSELSSLLPSFSCSVPMAEPSKAVSATDPSRWRKMVLTYFVSGCQPERASRKRAMRAGLKGSLSCCCKKNLVLIYTKGLRGRWKLFFQ